MSPISVSPLTSGDTYTCTVIAANATGPSATSAPSNSFVTSTAPVFATWTGTVRDRSGTAVGAWVNLTLNGTNGTVSATTAADGSFAMTVPAGFYSLVVQWSQSENWGPGDLPANGYLDTGSSGVTLTGNFSQDLTLQNANVAVHVLDSSGNPVSGAAVSNATPYGSPVFTAAPGIVLQGGCYYGCNNDQGTTDGTGTVVLHDLLTGTSTNSLSISLPNSGGNFNVAFPAITGDTSVWAQAPVFATWTGTVRDRSGTAVGAGVKLSLNGTNGTVSTTTAADGSFAMTVPAGSYSLVVQWSQSENWGPGDLPANGYLDTGSSGVALTGNLSQDLTLQNANVTVHVLDSSGNPVSGAAVSNATPYGSPVFTAAPGIVLQGGCSGCIYDQGTTDGTGTVVLHDLLTGTSTNSLSVSLPNSGGNFNVAFPAITGDTSVQAQAPVFATWTGTVRDRSGTAVGAGVNLYLNGTNGTVSTTTAADGSFAMTVPAGFYSLVVQWSQSENWGPGDLPASGLLDTGSSGVTLTGNLSQDLTLQNANVAVHVLDSSGNPVSGAAVSNATPYGSPVFTAAPGIVLQGGCYYGCNNDQGTTDGTGTVVLHDLLTGTSTNSLSISLPNSGGNFNVAFPAITGDTSVWAFTGGSGSILTATSTATPGQGDAGTQVVLSGHYWPQTGTATVRFTTGSDTGSAIVDANGILTGSITVGSSEPLGSDPIVVTMGSTSVTIPFSVIPVPTATATASANSGTSGAAIGISGSNWSPTGSPVSIHFTSGGDVGGTTVNPDGTISANITVGPSETLGPNPIIVTQGSTTVTVPFTVIAATSAPTLSLSTSSGVPGTVVTLSGTNWPTSGPLNVSFQVGPDTGTASVNASGDLTGSITVGALEPTGYNPVVVFDGWTFAGAAFTVDSPPNTPTVSLNPVQGGTGTTIALSGAGWNPSGGPVTVWFEYGTDLGTATVDSSGNLTGSIAVTGAEPLGVNPVVVAQGSTVVSSTFTVLPSSATQPTAFASPGGGGIGAVVSLTGQNWDPNGGAVSVHFTNGPDAGTATVNSAGTLTGSITVGAAEASGLNPIVVTQGSTNVMISVGVLPEGGGGSTGPPIIGHNPGLPGGSGLICSFPGQVNPVTTTVGSGGTYSINISAPTTPGPTYITCNDGTITFTIPFTVLAPTATASPSHGGQGVTVAVTGQYWNPSGGPVSLRFTNGTAAGTGTVAADGTLTASIAVDASEPTGSDPIVVTQGSLSVTVPFAVDATLSTTPTVTGISPTSGPAAGGTSVTITGTDLSGTTAVDFGGVPGSITADSATSITATSPAGSGTVDVTVTTAGGTSATSTADRFTYSSLTITTSSLPQATHCSFFCSTLYVAPLKATGGTGSYTWTLASGSLPSGFEVQSGGNIVGWPYGAAGSYPIVVKVTDSSGATATASLTLVVVSPTPPSPSAPLAITTTSLPQATSCTSFVGCSLYAAPLSAKGGVPGYTWSLVSGTLPANIELQPGGTITGQPLNAAAGSYPIVVEVTDSTGATAEVSLTLVVGP